MFILYTARATCKQNKIVWYRRTNKELCFRDLGKASYVTINKYASHTNKFLCLWMSHLEKRVIHHCLAYPTWWVETLNKKIFTKHFGEKIIKYVKNVIIFTNKTSKKKGYLNYIRLFDVTSLRLLFPHQ